MGDIAGIHLATLLTVTIGAAMPLLLAALGGLYSERSGVINIGLEGMMLVGAFAAAYVMYIVGATAWGPWLGVLAAGGAGGALALLHAVICVQMKADQIISGVALNILASQGTVFLSLYAFGGKGGSGLLPATMGKISLGGLQISYLVLVALVFLAGTWWLIFRTPFGLRLRACGEFPSAARTAGINVARMKFFGVITSGMLAGLAGAVLVNSAGNFSKDMSAGRGYIALAALIFGGWRPVPVLLACLLFGFAYALNFQLQGREGIVIPSEFLNMLPYLLTMFALAGLVGRSRPPLSLGRH